MYTRLLSVRFPPSSNVSMNIRFISVIHFFNKKNLHIWNNFATKRCRSTIWYASLLYLALECLRMSHELKNSNSQTEKTETLPFRSNMLDKRWEKRGGFWLAAHVVRVANVARPKFQFKIVTSNSDQLEFTARRASSHKCFVTKWRTYFRAKSRHRDCPYWCNYKEKMKWSRK